jgi:hypothetical protein
MPNVKYYLIFAILAMLTVLATGVVFSCTSFDGNKASSVCKSTQDKYCLEWAKKDFSNGSVEWSTETSSLHTICESITGKSQNMSDCDKPTREVCVARGFIQRGTGRV